MLRHVLLLSLALCLCSCKQYATVKETTPRFRPLATVTGSLATVQSSITRALTKDAKSPQAALGDLLTATSTASQELLRDPKNEAARDAYNFALARVFTKIREHKLSPWGQPLSVSSETGSWELTGSTKLISPDLLRQVEFIPADQMELGGTYTSERLTKPGLGAPLIATLMDGGALLKKDPFAAGKHIYYGITAIARFEGRRCIISFEDPLQVEDVRLGGKTWPLAADFTAPIALMLARENPKKMELARLLRPEKYLETARLARLQPYDPKKIPVLCVHGLMDSPATWTPLINTLRADPDIRARYQFWFFSYPSGWPYPHSAAVLRKQLDAIGKRYPDHKDIVLIGHSMGGCISRLMITDTGDQIWKDTFGTTPDKTKLSPETRKLFEDAIIFKTRQDVGRVIFIAAPLRGSDLATNWLGRFGSRLVKAPTTMIKAGAEAVNFFVSNPENLNLKRMPNSVDTMSPKNGFVRSINKLPLSTTIPYHVIVGDRGKGGNPDHTKPVKGDGFVPYWSSRLDGAVSELTVPSGHSAHQNPEAIKEVNRILKTHSNR
jgi:pimeloyl-ACP methyl ester carboxylesterase